MSHENVVQFMEKMFADEELKAKVGELQGDGGPDSVRQLLEVAAEAGFPFTEGDLDELFLAQAANEAEVELTAEQLEAVAGGADAFNATQSVDTSFNLQYLQLQQDMQEQNRQFTMMSNIMKVKHDTAKAAINNVR